MGGARVYPHLSYPRFGFVSTAAVIKTFVPTSLIVTNILQEYWDARAVACPRARALNTCRVQVI